MEIHVPVMQQECIGLMSEGAERDCAVFVDATLGAGGHTELMLRTFPACRVYAFDQDSQARHTASERLAEFRDRLTIIPRNFRELEGSLSHERGRVNGVLFDFGVSAMQLTSPDRGFSFGEDGPLDMRMDREGDAPTAADLLKEMDVEEMTAIFSRYGEERYARSIASGIIKARDVGRDISSTSGLVSLIREILPQPVQRKMGTHPARRVFQALRIAVNSELDVIHEGMAGAIAVASPGCVIVTLSYHSLEDRIVKQTFRQWQRDERGKVLMKKPMRPSDSEINENRSARSAKLRAFKTADDRAGKGV